MAGSYYFVDARAASDRELGYSDKWPSPMPLDQMELELLEAIGLQDEVDPFSFHPFFELLTDFGWYSLFNRGGPFVGHRHWATYIAPRLDSTIEKIAVEESKKLPIYWAFRAKAEEMLLRKYRFYGTG